MYFSKGQSAEKMIQTIRIGNNVVLEGTIGPELKPQLEELTQLTLPKNLQVSLHSSGNPDQFEFRTSLQMPGSTIEASGTGNKDSNGFQFEELSMKWGKCADWRCTGIALDWSNKFRNNRHRNLWRSNSI